MTAVPPLPPVMRAATVAVPIGDAFRIFTDEIGAWWPLTSHGVFGDRAGGVRFTDGALVETSVDGVESVWAEIVEWTPPERVVLDWHPGRAGSPTQVTISFAADGDLTRVDVHHVGWEIFGTEGAMRRRPMVGPGAWGHVLDHFADLTEAHGTGPAIDALRAAYITFFGEASAGGFGEPAAGEWTAAQVVAHVALNDLTMAATTRAVLAGESATFVNDVSSDRAALQGLCDRFGDLDALIGFGRAAAAASAGAAARLRPEQRNTPVACRLLDHGTTMLDDERPWGSMAIDIQAAHHLPAHTAQLRALRPHRELGQFVAPTC